MALRASRIPFMLLPGLADDIAAWRHQIDNLSDLADISVADLTWQDSIEAMARSVLAVMPERFALAGESMGGYVALEIIRQAPKRVLRLALIDTSARPETPEQTRRRLELMALVGEGRFRETIQQLLPLMIHEYRFSDNALMDELVNMSERVGADVFLRQQRAIMGRADSRPLLPVIRCPTLVLCGRQDLLTPLSHHEEMAAAIPDARLVVLDDCGHMATMEQPENVTHELRRLLVDPASLTTVRRQSLL